MSIKPIKILLMVDNEGDILLIQEAMIEAKIINTMEVARDGSEAIKLL